MHRNITMNADTQKAIDALSDFLSDEKIKTDTQLTLGRKDYPEADFEKIFMHFFNDKRAYMSLGKDFLKITKN